jgi:hypothetical protein
MSGAWNRSEVVGRVGCELVAASAAEAASLDAVAAFLGCERRVRGAGAVASPSGTIDPTAELSAFTWLTADLAAGARFRGTFAVAVASAGGACDVAGSATAAPAADARAPNSRPRFFGGVAAGSGSTGLPEPELPEPELPEPELPEPELRESSLFTIAGALPGRVGDRATHRVPSRTHPAAVPGQLVTGNGADALLILHVCDPYQLPQLRIHCTKNALDRKFTALNCLCTEYSLGTLAIVAHALSFD